MGARGWRGRTKPTCFCTDDANVKINNPSGRRRVWSKRRESQMQLTLGIVNAHSTLQNIISLLYPPGTARSPISSLGRGRSRGAGRGRASCMAGQLAPSPAGGCAAAGSARRQSRCWAEERAAPFSGVRGSSSLICRILDGSGSTALGQEHPAHPATPTLSGRGRWTQASAGEPRLERGEGLQQVRGVEWEFVGQPPGGILKAGREETVL